MFWVWNRKRRFLVSVDDMMDCIPTEVKQLIESYTPKSSKSTEIELNIQLTDEIPVYQWPRRMANIEKDIVENQLKEWIKDGVVKPGYSDYAAAVVVTKKKDLTHRVCVDYRNLNKKIIEDRYPSPLVEDVLDSLQKTKVFSSIDLKNGVFQVPVGKDSQKYLAFVTHSGQYLFLKTPFGCCNSPAVFQRYINEVFRDLVNRKIVIVYMDDVCILAENREQGIEHLKLVLEVAAEAGFQIKWKKCQFRKSSIEFLGFIIEDGLIKPSPTKIASIQKFIANYKPNSYVINCYDSYFILITIKALMS